MQQQDNDLLTAVRAGTPMGELMRRYWHPVAAVTELDERPLKPVRLMGEDLVLYKDLSGNYGLLDRYCAHRNADLSNGMVEANGVRCSYHGWAYEGGGRCVAKPFEDIVQMPGAPTRGHTRLKAYKVQAKGGMLWTYMGPEPTPLVPDWEPLSWNNGFVQIVFAEVPCNWLQCQENSIDPVHFEWQHFNFSVRAEGKVGPYVPRHLKLSFKEFDYGYTYGRVSENSSEDDELWQVGRVCLWPNALFTSNHFEWRVPIDDENTLSVTWSFARVPRDREPYVQERIPYWYGPLKDQATGRWIDTHVMNQDFMAWVGQGRITDRTREQLGRSDQGIVAIRRRFLADLEAIKEGRDPKGLIRDPEQNVRVPLPIIGRRHYIEGLSREQMAADPWLALQVSPDSFIFQAGQPEHVVAEYEAAMGLTMNRQGFVKRPGE